MSKKDKAVSVALNETQVNGQTVTEVLIGKQLIGQVTEVAADRFDAEMASSNQAFAHTKSFDESLQEVLSAYHLHKG
ncbi:DUF2969 domain-containing protein [Lactiplantibacillus mudanjiangensis]|uniref:DUF2969 domain-containing protein n=1 Tax=Lactiplantibacillus mudanjiangensis TaxID=1296538 RepID=A0A660E3C2_9LACO|nr:DUF2969 domain-containing protein [Lactiplantibacillus mudanjiangensis]VDG19154.1 hypothetical protein MUDAN_BIHEEGNE_01032 [Lactiplantibacillus mudanjiangensis]VDG25680.1 hypothetical protein MUDAN_IGPPGNFN_01232 [Lactiplantibacillus mudanjiangensis]VDG29923.1 hypothetical protein MUDAN_MDHGFNIF_01455 [Lactiplantibacillus mudanjiangensis]VDG33225.1 hypothetical protein MUDAN_DOGOELCO_02428 [Lactiplantibacillus mudanjiangensis]